LKIPSTCDFLKKANLRALSCSIFEGDGTIFRCDINKTYVLVPLYIIAEIPSSSVLKLPSLSLALNTLTLAAFWLRKSRGAVNARSGCD
jgi:hypothetical protein